MVLVKEVDGAPERARIQCLHGRASLDPQGRLELMAEGGFKFSVPNSALPNILPSDGTAMLRDAEYFVMVKLHPDIDFIRSDRAEDFA